MMFWELVAMVGEINFWLVLSLFLYVISIFKKNKDVENFSINLFLLLLISGGFTLALKNIFKIPRPCAGLDYCPEGFSFPSGHAVILFSMFSYVYFSRKNKVLSSVLLATSLLVSISRIVLNVHKIEDVVFGGVFGILLGFIYSKQLSKHVMNLIRG